MQVVLLEPEIPPNTGNIARTCAATGTVLHLVEPLGFAISDRYLKRAGVDYWHLVDVQVHPHWTALLEALSPAPQQLHFFTSHGGTSYHRTAYAPTDILIFGRESTGLPPALLEQYGEQCRQIPMVPGVRSLNLSNAVAIVLYEALRQQGFPNMGWA